MGLLRIIVIYGVIDRQTETIHSVSANSIES